MAQGKAKAQLESVLVSIPPSYIGDRRPVVRNIQAKKPPALDNPLT
ncbi:MULTISPECIES: hypothetical protein [unclassified Synechocystis]|nr:MULTISPECIES: hypothetical protein [unclassified Synechocystis]MCT0254933.1 hypothetical protein [Synechocystis sp. CS-94]